MEALNKLGLDYIAKHPVEAIKTLTALIREEANPLNEKVGKPEADYYNSGQGSLFKDIDYILLSDYEEISTHIWEKYITSEGLFSWEQHGGIATKISDSTMVSIRKNTINGKNVILIHPTSMVVNFDSVKEYTYHMAEMIGVSKEDILKDEYDLARATEIKGK